MKTEDGLQPIFKIMIVTSFFMLSMLTWGASPLQKLVEKVQEKETVKGQMKACNEIRAMLPVYEGYVENIFKMGCIWQSRNIAIFLNKDDPKRVKEIEDAFSNEEGGFYEQVNNECLSAGAEYQSKGNLKELMVNQLYFEKLKCPITFDNAKKLGIEDEDVQ